MEYTRRIFEADPSGQSLQQTQCKDVTKTMELLFKRDKNDGIICQLYLCL